MCLALLMGTTSCKDWLDVNTDPDSPSAETALVEVRLPWIQYYFSYAMGNTNFRANCVSQMYIGHVSRSGNYLLTNWDYIDGPSTTAYQNWFTGGASNVPYLISKAEAEGATHYIAAAEVVKAMGSIMMVDLFGEMPFDESADQSILAPHYDDGDYTYAACFDLLDDAIAKFSTSQIATATPLSKGDIWFGGDTQKWIKLCYGLKARWMMNLSKMKSGDSQYVSFDANEIRNCLSKAPQSTGEDLYATYENVETATYNYTVSDAYGPNTTWDCAAWGLNQRINRWYVNLLTNFKGSGVMDPRAPKLIPSSMYKAKLNASNAVESCEWLMDAGVNEYEADSPMLMVRHNIGNIPNSATLILADKKMSYGEAAIVSYYGSDDNFIAAAKKYYSDDNATFEKTANGVVITFHPGAMVAGASSPNPANIEDIKYVQLAADALFENNGFSASDMNCYRSATTDGKSAGFVQGTGTFYTRPDSDNDLFTYAEACFIEAELDMLEGKTGDAYNAYIKGIKAHFDRMNRKLNEWKGKGCCTTAKGFDVSFAYAPIPQDDIDTYMASAAVCQSSSQISMSHIMMQKFIAMGPMAQNWNDVRKYDYYMNGVYTEMKCPAYRPGANYDWVPGDNNRRFYPRRWFHSSHENNYNQTNLTASYAKYAADGITITGGRDRQIPSIPIFWDKNAPVL